MTINEDVPGIEIAVQIGGVDATEYEADDAGDEEAACPTLTKFIECVDDALFSLRMRVDDTYDWGYKDHSLSIDVHLDGQWMRARIFNKAGLKATMFDRYKLSSEAVIRGREEVDDRTGQWVLRKFQFSTVKTVDDAKKERVEKDMEVAKNLGVIEVKVMRGTEHGDEAPMNSKVKNKNLELSEKSLKGKAISHGTTLGPAETTVTPRYVDFRNLPEDEGPIAKFRFCYRSREALKREMIIPRTPAPRSPILAALSEAERDRLARERLEQLNETKVKGEGGRPIKREYGEVYDLTQDILPGRPLKMTRLNSGKEIEVVDLTGD
ncbi:hypothetical protein BJ170DRAFT_589823 [Xylariales sp. AK1849]|nr:hypothetical protein BJ170DRAFT_589823 [Xylariales sp. AK1849]